LLNVNKIVEYEFVDCDFVNVNNIVECE